MDFYSSVLTSLEEHLAALDLERSRVTQAITTMRGLAGNPSVLKRKTPAKPKAQPRGRPAGRVEKTEEEASDLGARVLAVVKAKAPVSTGPIATELSLTPSVCRQALRQLSRRGLVHSTGVTNMQRWHLGAGGKAKAPAPKEAP